MNRALRARRRVGSARSAACFLLLVLNCSACSFGYRAGIPVAEELHAPLAQSIAAAGILDRRNGGQAAGALPDGADRIARALGIEDASDRISPEDLAVLEATPAALQVHADRLRSLQERLGKRYLVSGTAGIGSVDVEKRWVILVVIPIGYSVVSIPIPVTYGEETDQPRAALTMRVVDLQEAEIVGTSVDVQVNEVEKGDFDAGSVKQALKTLELEKKHLQVSSKR